MNKTIFKQLKKDKGNWLNETEVRQGWIKIIGDALNIPFQMERQRVDASYNRVIIEFKDKGLFNGSTSSSAFKNAVFDRLKKYIPTRAKLESLDNEDYIGIVTDAEHIAFARYSRGKIVHDALLPLSESSVSLIVKALTDCKWVPVTSENLITDFGHSSDAGCNMLQALSDALSERLEKKNNNKIKMIFEEWKALYGQTSNLSISQVNGILDNIGFQVNFSEQKSLKN
ncbi:hypothetical protein [sulfur-oxidizing endosymbiont of Gigantopelta aegis]|uniref:hypothetical protein n=1 Tax=sulfur-oxidizing endosymbiont of Gigantopelta aegis TaxID=2794934 RepID=UPI0018DDB987|nr:hypothetical protein [sulfur-oxidizing endosymbiont of Gigantopelta aegis]